MFTKHTNPKSFTRIIILTTFIIALLVINASAQDQAFTDEQLATLKKSANEKLESKIYRSVTTIENFYGEGAKYNSVRKTTVEIVPPDRRHTIYEKRDANGVEIDEWIYIGKKIYHKPNNGDWEEYIPSGGGSGSGFGDGTGDAVQKIMKTHNLKKGEMVNGQKSDLYEIITEWAYESGYSKFYKLRYWFNEEGLFSKTETENTSTKSDDFYRITVDYTYDPNMKIEAPLIKKQK